MKNIAEQINKASSQFRAIFGVNITYNGQEITAIYDNEETNLRESNKGMFDRTYFGVFVEDIPNPAVNDEIIYCGDKYRVIKIADRDECSAKVETERNTSAFRR